MTARSSSDSAVYLFGRSMTSISPPGARWRNFPPSSPLRLVPDDVVLLAALVEGALDEVVVVRRSQRLRRALLSTRSACRQEGVGEFGG